MEGNSQYTKGKTMAHSISDETQAKNKRDIFFIV